jgi:hypothetical protein
MSLIATILIMSLLVAGHTWQRVTAAAAFTEDVTRTQEFLRERLATLEPDDPEQAFGAPAPFLVSNANVLEFSSPPPSAIPSGIVRYQIALSDLDPGSLEVRFRPERSDPTGSSLSDWSTERLLTHVAGFSVQFLEKQPGSAARWINERSGSTQLPLLIRIDVTFPANDRRRWPSLYIEPRVDTRSSCTFDVVGQRCRSAT